MPNREDLPPELRPITRRNALELSDERWRYDVGRLITTLDGLLGETSAVATQASKASPAPAAADERQRAAISPGRLLLEGVLLAAATAFAARAVGSLIDTPNSTAGAIANVILRRAETWALVGAALAVWLGFRTGKVSLLRPGMRGLLLGAIAGAIGGAIWALPYYLPDPNLTAEVGNRWEVASLAVTGGCLGALIGAGWQPRRLAAGLAGGIVAGALVRLLINAAFADDPSEAALALSFALAAIAIAGLVLAVLLALDRQQSGVKAAAYPATEL